MVLSDTALPRLEVPTISDRKSRPVLLWASIGAVFVALSVYLYVAWVVTGEARPSSPGIDHIPSATRAWISVLQIATPIGALVTIGWAVRTSLRHRRLSFDAMLLIGWVSIMWLDPVLNYTRPAIFYSAAFVNFGSWSERIPGWMSPNGREFPESVFSMSCYGWLVIGSIVCCYFMRRAKARWPRLGVFGVILVGYIGIALFDLLVETFFVRTGAVAYPGVVRGLSIWGGHTYQFPIYESALWGGLWAATGALRYFRDDRGHSVAERGIDEVRMPARWKTVVRLLAVCGFCNVAGLAYNVGFNWFALHVDQAPQYPSHLRAGICGPGTGYDCPGPTRPIPLPQ